MSGSSLDGLDLAICRLRMTEGSAPVVSDWEILAATTDEYPRPWQARLRSAPHLPGPEIWRLHADLGHWIGRRARAFLDDHPEHAPTLVASHGHTVFHDPAAGFTTQIGDGAAIAHRTGLPVVTELRGADVAAGGQGAPIAPVADKYLFPEYRAFLNLGGIANVSLRRPDGSFIAGDVSGCCQILDRLAARAGLAYDEGGRLAASGTFHPGYVTGFAALDFHGRGYPKSLGNAWVRDELWPLVDDAGLSAADALHSFGKWLAVRIATDLTGLLAASGGAAAGAERIEEEQKDEAGKPDLLRVLVTGGGARNTFLLNQLRLTQETSPQFEFVVEADTTVGDFKEAALVALCGLLRVKGIPNSLPSATGAERATVNGALYHP